MSEKTVSPTSFALLGLLALREWTAYELAQQVRRSLRWFFPRAERAVYTEAKRLVIEGWATAGTSWTGKRRATTYQITDDGRAALDQWLKQSGPPLQIESEQLLRLFIAGRNDVASSALAVQSIADDASATLAELGELAGQWKLGDPEFRGRAATNAISMMLLVDLHRTAQEWAKWAAPQLHSLAADPAEAEATAERLFASIQAMTEDEGVSAGRLGAEA